MDCKRCGSNRILVASAHCRDLGCFEIAGQEHNGYVPDDLGIGGGDDVAFDLCLDCGQMQGDWPLPHSKMERKAVKEAVKLRLEPSEFARTVVDRVIHDGYNDTQVLTM